MFNCQIITGMALAVLSVKYNETRFSDSSLDVMSETEMPQDFSPRENGSYAFPSYKYIFVSIAFYLIERLVGV